MGNKAQQAIAAVIAEVMAASPDEWGAPSEYAKRVLSKLGSVQGWAFGPPGWRNRGRCAFEVGEPTTDKARPALLVFLDELEGE